MTQGIEGVAWASGAYYDALAYQTNGPKLVACQGGLKYITLTPTRPIYKTRIFIRPKSKRMVPYSFFGCLMGIVKAGGLTSYSAVADTTDVTHVYSTARVRYLEWNSEFDMARV